MLCQFSGKLFMGFCGKPGLVMVLSFALLVFGCRKAEIDQHSEFVTVYGNGTNDLVNLKTPDGLWKVRLIKEYFASLMFEDAGV